MTYRFFLSAFLTIAFYATSLPICLAAGPASGTQVALIDLGFIFKNHAGFSGERKALQQKTTGLKTQEDQQKKYLTEQSEKLRKLAPGSPEYKALETQLAQQASDFQVQGGLQRKSLMEEEAKLYHRTYMEVQSAVNAICDQHGIQLVLRYDREKIDSTNPEAIKRGILNSVVYHNRLDITDMVLKATQTVATNPGPPNGRTTNR